MHVDQWQWTISFYAPSHRGGRTEETACDFDAARNAFEIAWHRMAPQITATDRLEHLRRHAWKYKMWETRCQLPTQVADGRRDATAAPRSRSPTLIHASTRST